MGTARIDSYSSSGRLENALKRVEMGLCGQHDRLPVAGRVAGDALARLEPRPPGHLLDARAVRRPQHQLVGGLVVEVDEARVRSKRVRHVARHEREHLLEVERRVDGRDRLGQQPQVTGGLVHRSIVGATGVFRIRS
jgi:hypothetical protein